MKSVIALVGRPNVGKSTLFNRLTRSRQALVADMPGLTRDRIYGAGRFGDDEFIVIDTAGIGGKKDELQNLMTKQARLAMEEADVVLLLTDARAGLTSDDEIIARQLRAQGKPFWLVANKAEGLDADVACAEFQRLGIANVAAISAAHGDGVPSLMAQVLAELPEPQEEQLPVGPTGIKIAVAGRPNVGKSTLVNRMLGEERVLTYDEAGTTRDSIYIPFRRDDVDYTLIDTAGVRRRHNVTEHIEKISVIKTLQAIDDAHVVILVLDAHDVISDQDASLAGFVLEAGRALVVAINKWDGLESDARQRIKSEVERKLHFFDFARIHFISALHGTGVGEMYQSINAAYRSAMAKFPTPQLTRILEDAIQEHQPPLVKGRRIKLRYAHQGGSAPPVIVIHGSQTSYTPDAYRRYLSNKFRHVLRIEGTPLRIELRDGENPFAGKKNVLTKRQIVKKKRLVKFTKHKKRVSRRNDR